MKILFKHRRKIAAFFLLNFSVEIFSPMQALALTGGPSQPEVQSFKPVDVSEMVDPFSGDFSYNLPVLDVDGYPLNLVYNSNVSSDQEASWVGLGWNLNPGVINRGMRGIPDDFSGDVIVKEQNIKPNRTYGVTGGLGWEIAGSEKRAHANVGLGVKYNNYNGLGIEQSLSLSYACGDPNKAHMNAGLGITSGSNGLTVAPTISFSSKLHEGETLDRQVTTNIGVSFNSREGLSRLSIGMSGSIETKKGNSRDNTLHRNSKNAWYKGGHTRVESHVASGSSLTIGMNSYTPAISMSMMNLGLTASIKAGSTVLTSKYTGNLGVYFSSQWLKDKRVERAAYGYMNSQNAVIGGEYNKHALLDFNREKDGEYNLNTVCLPVTNFTYDIFSVNGQGVGGVYRPFRTDMGAVYDPYSSNTSVGISGGGEVGAGNVFESGLDVHVNVSNSHSGIWKDDNPALDKYKFRSKSNIPSYQIYHEPYVFRSAGELSVDEEPFYSESFLKSAPVRVELAGSGAHTNTTNKLIDKDGNQSAAGEKNYRSSRVKRAQVLSILTRDQVKDVGVQDLLPNAYAAPGHHISEVSILRTDGARYVYGLPAYNLRQEEVTFSISNDIEQPGDKGDFDLSQRVMATEGLVRYTDEDNDPDKNDRGVDNYYSNTIMPAYAHSYLLTAVLSTDYVDVDAVRGPSDDDLGNYTLFKYKKLPAGYKWRVPYESYMANYNQGIKSDAFDDKGNYIYGEKELWYLEKIETKNAIAIFETEARKDAFEAGNENGGLDKDYQSMLLLRKISLYSKADYENNTSPVPIKIVHFEYDYSLCPGVPNNSGVAETVGSTNLNAAKGKLTLKKVYSTYGTSNKAMFSPYEFSYGDASTNKGYGPKNYDRWGNYKENTGGFTVGSPMHTSEFPYVEQNKTQADINAAQWTLKQITLPSKGKISIQYESDDYAYVQDQKAMQMFKIHSIMTQDEFDNSLSTVMGSPLAYDHLYEGSDDDNIRNIIVFPLQSQITASTGEVDEFKSKYLSGIKKNLLYFRFLVAIPPWENTEDYDYISGYAEIEESGLIKYNSSNNTHGWIKVKKVGIGDRDNSDEVHPIAKAAWQFARAHTPRKIYDDPTIYSKNSARSESVNSVTSIAQQIFSNRIMVDDLIEAFKGPNRTLRGKDFGKFINLAKSFIKLTCPTRAKLGGGSRVKKIEISDEWNSLSNMSGYNASTYGKEYSYKTFENGVEISSGVAENEPGIGSDESPLRGPIYGGKADEKLLAPDDKHYLEDPVGESLYPDPSVGYSRIVIKDLSYTNVSRHAAGSTVKEFYTAKDFPVLVSQTDIDIKKKKTMAALRILRMGNKDFVTVSQGHTIELNDMHGKPKSEQIYDAAEAQISGVKYIYQSTIAGSGKKLVNTATVINRFGEKETKEIGVEYDFITDFREQKTTTIGTGVNANMGGFLVGLITGGFATIFPFYNHEATRFRSAVVTKVVHRYGLLKEVIAYDMGLEVSTVSEAYDAETGQVILTSTKNEFEQDIYTLKYPAHWAYKGMGPAYRNLGMTFDDVDFDINGDATVVGAQYYFVEGDEVLCAGEKGWVISATGNTIRLVNRLGLPFRPNTNDNSLWIYRSGARNILNAEIGSVVSLVNPLDGLGQNHLTNILAASAMEYREGWKTDCQCFTTQNDLVMLSKNDYITGKRGIWRPFKSYAYLTERGHSYENANTNIRKDGAFVSFSPFWQISNLKWDPHTTNWTWTNEVTEFSPFGAEIENKDALSRHSAALYGYNNSLPVAVSSNAKYTDIGFDGMEDYDFMKCSNDHFSYRSWAPGVVNHISHTGKKSLSVNQGAPKAITKTISPCQ